jgi:anti-anti-sigma factor
MQLIGSDMQVLPLPGRATERVITLILEGELTLADLARVGDELFRLANRGVRNVVLDFSQVAHLDFRGIRPLVARTTLFRQAGGDIRIAGLSGYVFHIFRAAGAHDAFKFFASTDNARASFFPGAKRAG